MIRGMGYQTCEEIKGIYFFKHKIGAPIFNFDFISVGKFYFISESAFE